MSEQQVKAISSFIPTDTDPSTKKERLASNLNPPIVPPKTVQEKAKNLGLTEGRKC